MKTIKMKLFAGLLVLPLLLPQMSLAYFTTDQTATKISDRTIIYTVKYKFGLTKRGLYMPILATRDLDTTTTEFSAGYSLLDNNEKTELGSTNAIILTSSPNVTIKNKKYYIPAGKSAEFTLVTIVNISPEEVNNNELSLLVTHLPFTMIEDGKNYSNQLNPSELQYYLTPSVIIGD